MSDVSDEINTNLANLLRSDRSISVVLLGDKTGLTVARLTRLLTDQTMSSSDMESLGAIAAAVFTGASEQGNVLDLGKIGIMVADFAFGKLLTAECGQGILVVVTDKDAQLGLIRVQMRRASQTLSTSLDNLLESSTREAVPTTEEGDTSERIADALKELEDF